MKLAEVFDSVAGADAPVEFVAYDGSKTGAPGSPVRIEVRSPRALELFMSHPGQVGLARAYVAGEVEIVGDVVELFEALSDVRPKQMPTSEKLRLVRDYGPTFVKAGKVFNRGELPPEEKKLRGGRHSKGRDAEAIAHHYDVSNEFYRYVLGPSMAYTCAVFPTADATLEQAQEEKFDLVCRKLDLKPGMRVLDVGCGWGGMVLRAWKVERQFVSATTAMSLKATSMRSRRSDLPSTSAKRTTRRTSRSCAARLRQKVAC